MPRTAHNEKESYDIPFSSSISRVTTQIHHIKSQQPYHDLTYRFTMFTGHESSVIYLHAGAGGTIQLCSSDVLHRT